MPTPGLGMMTTYAAAALAVSESSSPPPAGAAACTSSDGALLDAIGWIGCTSAWILFVSPIPTMRTIVRTGTVGDFSALPYLVSCLQCSLWTVYALPSITPCKTQPLVTNGVGAVLELGYLLVFIRFSRSAAARWAMIGWLMILALTGGAISAVAILVAPQLDIPKWPDPDASATTTMRALSMHPPCPVTRC